MKKFTHIIPIIAALSLGAAPGVRAGQSAVPVTDDSVNQLTRQVKIAVDQSKAEAAQQIGKAQVLLENQLAQADDTFQKAIETYNSWADSNDRRVRGRNPGFGWSGPGGSTRALIIRSTDTDSAAQANLEEDLAVMLRVFDKAIGDVRGTKPSRPVMGINLYFSPSTAPNRTMYLEGYGALFLMKVDFPLIAPPVAKEEPKEKPATDSNWEAARRELFGAPGDSTLTVPARDIEEYDAERVTRLKDGLLDAFKSASHIRNLKGDDSVTVCVFGGAGQRILERTSGETKGKPDNKAEITIVNAPGRGSILTIKAKKSDLDAFAKGKLTLDEFRKKAAITAYQGGASESAF